MIDIATPPKQAGDRARVRAGLRLWRFVPVAILVSGLVAGYLAGLHEHASLDAVANSRAALADLAGGSGVLAGLAFVAACLVLTAFGFPAPSVLAVFGGFLFGWAAGALLAVTGATSGATLMFLALRSAFGEELRHRLGRVGARFARGFERDAFTYLLALRLAPFIPFVAVNIAPALFRVRPATFVAATLLGMLPLIAIFAWLGQGVEAAFASATAAGRELAPADLVTPQVTLALSALALVAVLAPVVRRLARPLRPKADPVL